MSVNSALGLGNGSTPITYNNVIGAWLSIQNTTSSPLTLTNLFGYPVELVAGDTCLDLFPASLETDLLASKIPYSVPTVLTSASSPIQAVEHATYVLDTSGGSITINVPVSAAPAFVDANGEIYGSGWTRFSVIDAAGDSGTNVIKIADPTGTFNLGSNIPAYAQKAVVSATYTSATGILAVTFGSAPFGASVGSTLNGKEVALAGLTTSAGSASAVNGTFAIVSTASSGTVINLQAVPGLGTITINSGVGNLLAGGGTGVITLNTNYGGWKIVNANDIQGNAQEGIISAGGSNPGGGLGVGAYTIPYPVTNNGTPNAQLGTAEYIAGSTPGYNYLNVGRIQVQNYAWLPTALLNWLLGPSGNQPNVSYVGSVEGGTEGGQEPAPSVPEYGALPKGGIYTHDTQAGASTQPFYPISVNESQVTESISTKIQETLYVNFSLPPVNYGAQPSPLYPAISLASGTLTPLVNNSAGV